MNGTPLIQSPLFLVALLFVFLWLIPLIHALRSGKTIATIEVLALLVTALGAPAGLALYASKASEPMLVGLGILGALELASVSLLLWFAALIIAIAAELNREIRRANRPPPLPMAPRTRISEPHL